MAEIQYIKHLWEQEGKSLREISRVTGLSFQTVQKYAYKEKWDEERQPNTEPENYPVLGPYIPTIDQWLSEDAREPRKQRHTIQRISDRLREECGYQGSYSSVKRYVRKKKYLMRRETQGFLQIEQPKGHAQIDFGALKYYDGMGREGTAHALTVTFPYSNIGYTQVFKGENQECLLEGMKRIFEHIGGVPLRIRADNMKSAVSKVLEGTQRELSEGFSRFMLHYRFEADFCNPASGNEKGNVENKVGYSRRNFFVPVPVIEDFEVFNRELWAKCERNAGRDHYRHKVPMWELWQEERQVLLALPPHEYDVFRYESARINNYGQVTVDSNRYGVAPELAGRTAQVRISFDKVAIYYDHALLATYQRSYGQNEEIADWRQYVGILCKKPGGAEHTRFFNQLPKLWQAHLLGTQGKERKTALKLLMEIVKDGNDGLCDHVLEIATLYGRCDSESLRHCYYSLVNAEHRPTPLKLPATVLLNYDPSLLAYDSLTGGGLHG